MRDLLFKNLTSEDRKKKIIASSEIVNEQGVHSVIRRHFVCLVKEIKDVRLQRPLPYMYILKERNTSAQREKFFCRIKGSVCAAYNGRLFLVLFMHSLKISLSALGEDSMKCSDDADAI